MTQYYRNKKDKDIEANYKPSYFWEGLPDVFEEAF